MDNYRIRDVVEWMTGEGYFILVKGKYLVSAKFNTEVRGVTEGLRKLPTGKLVVVETDRPAPSLKPEEWRDLYMAFIMKCKVPEFGRLGNGGMYPMNKYSEPAMKKFRELAEKEQIDLKRLEVVTSAFYADNRIKAKPAISTFILEGQWRSSYNEITPENETDGTMFRFG